MFKFKRKNDPFKEINRRLKQLECDHSETHFVECWLTYYGLYGHYDEICSKCGKHLSRVTEEEKLKKERKQLLMKIKDINKKLKKGK